MPPHPQLSAPATTEQWRRLGMQIRLALHPDDPRIVRTYLMHAEALIAEGRCPPWPMHDRSLSLLLDTACDALLPIAWRLTCLDACCRPLGQLGALVHDDTSAARLRLLARRLASFSCNPCEPSHP